MAVTKVYSYRTEMETQLAQLRLRRQELVARLEALPLPRDASELLALEHSAQEAGGQAADVTSACLILQAHLDEAFCREVCQQAHQRLRAGGQRVKSCGWVRVHFLLPHGLHLWLRTPCFRPRPARKRRHGRRGATGTGCYPVLEQLGITSGVSPATRELIARQAVLSSSYVEAQEQLQRQGLDVDVSVLVRVAVQTGAQALVQRDLTLEQARQVPLPEQSLVAGKRLRVALDGGRVRVRYTRRGRGIRPGKNHRRPFTLSWREPRLITIDVLDATGEMDRAWLPVYELSLGEAEEVFTLLTGLLRLIGAHLAAEVVFVADGAEWIWRRTAQLAQDAGIPAERFHEVLDFFHAAQHVRTALEACHNLSATQRDEQFADLTERLRASDGAASVIAELHTLARGRRAAAIQREVKYLTFHQARMSYAELRAQHLPIGSGVVESGVRRVINLRFKAASMSWRPEHVLPLLYLRAVLKAGHWDALMEARAQGCHWLQRGFGQVPPAHLDKEAA
jgi:hypothetical protein